MSVRKRLSPEESRSSALQAARALLIEAGPQAVTLKAVAGRIGRTHANLLHHFGSAAGLQKELARFLTETVCETIKQAVDANRAGLGSAREVVDLAFDAFDKEGAGALASWMILTGNEDALEPIVGTIHQLVEDIAVDGAALSSVDHLREDTLSLVLLAMGDALIGKALSGSLGLPTTAARDAAQKMLEASLDETNLAD